MRPFLSVAALLLFATSAGAQMSDPPPAPSLEHFGYLSPEQVASVLGRRDADLAQARFLCFNHSFPTGTLLGCMWDPMCNRAYEGEVRDACLSIDKQWTESGAAARAEKARHDQDEKERAFIREKARAP